MLDRKGSVVHRAEKHWRNRRSPEPVRFHLLVARTGAQTRLVLERRERGSECDDWSRSAMTLFFFIPVFLGVVPGTILPRLRHRPQCQVVGSRRREAREQEVNQLHPILLPFQLVRDHELST